MSSVTFAGRLGMADRLVQIMREEVWETDALRPVLIQEQFGSENYVRTEVHGHIRHTHTPTTHHIRFAPDYFVVDARRPELTYLLEYKFTNSPLSYERRLAELRCRCRRDLQFSDVGQWEAAAYDNYTRLRTLDVRVCILNYVPFHPRPLLCEYVDKVVEIYRSPGVGTTTAGSRTPWINFDLQTMRSLDAFLCDEHSLSIDLVRPLCEAAIRRLRFNEGSATQG